MKLKINKKHQKSDSDDFELEFYRTVLSCSRLIKKINRFMKHELPPREYQTDLGEVVCTGNDVYTQTDSKTLYLDERGIVVTPFDDCGTESGFYTALTKGDEFDRTSRGIVKDFINQNPDVTYIVLRMPQILKIMLNEYINENS